MSLQEHRCEVARKLAELRSRSCEFERSGVRFFHSEGHEPIVDITDQIRAETADAIKQYQRLLEIIDESVLDSLA